MLNDLNPYPAYKDSKLPWLGSIPSHWEVRRNGRLFAQRNETGFAELPILEVSINTGVKIRDMDAGRKQVMSNRDAYKRAAKGDIAYNMMRMWQGAVGVAPADGLVSPAYVVARPLAGVEPRFYSYLFRTAAYMDEVDKFSRGIVKDRNRLYWDQFKQMPSAFPLQIEQRQISDFLDGNAVVVRRLVRNKRRLIELLNEQKQAIITLAVTRGLDPKAELKPSGIDWLGSVPDRWKIVRAVEIFRERVESGKDGLPILVVSLKTGVTIGGKTDEDGRPRRLIEDMARYKRAHQSDIAYNTMRMWQGAVGVVPTDGLVSPAYVVVAPRQPLNPTYFCHLFRTENCRQEINRYSTGIVTDRNRLYWDQFKQLSLPLPPVAEQDAIVNDITTATAALDLAIAKADREIQLIREYRTRLISDVVTGKVDVRHVALPESEVEPVAIEPLDADLETESAELDNVTLKEVEVGDQ